MTTPFTILHTLILCQAHEDGGKRSIARVQYIMQIIKWYCYMIFTHKRVIIHPCVYLGLNEPWMLENFELRRLCSDYVAYGDDLNMTLLKDGRMMYYGKQYYGSDITFTLDFSRHTYSRDVRKMLPNNVKHPRSSHIHTLNTGNVVVFDAGLCGNYMSYMSQFDPVTNKWNKLAIMTTAILPNLQIFNSVSLSNGDVLMFMCRYENDDENDAENDTENDAPIMKCYKYVAEISTIVPTCDLPFEDTDYCLTALLPNGNVLTCSTENPKDDSLTFYIYNTQTDTWTDKLPIHGDYMSPYERCLCMELISPIYILMLFQRISEGYGEQDLYLLNIQSWSFKRLMPLKDFILRPKMFVLLD